MKTRDFLAVALLVILMVHSCEPLERVSNIPEIQFKSLSAPYLVDTSAIIYHAVDLVFSFKDGDSDIGTDRDSAADPNLFLIPFEKVDGVYDSLDPVVYGKPYKILKNELLNTGRTVRGEIKVQIPYFLYPPPFDTIRYDFYIIDQAGHESNVATTSDLGF
jgi:hypothetical protein